MRPKSKKPKKQRKYIKTAHIHERRKMVSSHLSDELRKEHGKRSVRLKKGDEIVAMRGRFTKRAGKVSRVDLNTYRVYVDGFTIRKTDGTERLAPIHPSNLKVTKLNLEDKKRKAALKKKADVKGTGDNK